MICAFSLAIIFLVAFIVMFIFLIILNIVFWWLPFLKICFPIPRSPYRDHSRDDRARRPGRPLRSRHLVPAQGRRPDGRMVWSSGGGLNVRECIRARAEDPARPERVACDTSVYGCGLDRYLHEPASALGTLRLITEEVQQALTQWEPRIRLDDVTSDDQSG